MTLVTVTPNPAVDTTYLIDRLAVGAINRVGDVLPMPGGKGVNVAKVLAILGERPIATGFLGGRAGAFVAEALRACGVQPAFLAVPGETRTCLTVVETGSGRTTEIREPGAPVTGLDGERLLAALGELVHAGDTVVISGSLPPGMAPTFVADLISRSKALGAYVALDASGEVLRHGIEAGPDLIKPNEDELYDVLGVAAHDDIIERVRGKLIGTVLPAAAGVLLSRGAAGATLIRRDRARLAVAPAVAVANTVGSGDALLAGFVSATARGWDDATALARAVATGTAAAMQAAVGAVDPVEIERLLPRVRVEAVQADAALAVQGAAR